MYGVLELAASIEPSAPLKRRLGLSKPETLIGRDAARVDLVLASKKYECLSSRVHAKIIWSQAGNGTWTVEDSSLNGIFVNHIKVKSKQLQDGDMIVFGHTLGSKMQVGDRLPPASLANSEFIYRFSIEDEPTFRERQAQAEQQESTQTSQTSPLAGAPSPSRKKRVASSMAGSEDGEPASPADEANKVPRTARNTTATTRAREESEEEKKLLLEEQARAEEEKKKREEEELKRRQEEEERRRKEQQELEQQRENHRKALEEAERRQKEVEARMAELENQRALLEARQQQLSEVEKQLQEKKQEEQQRLEAERVRLEKERADIEKKMGSKEEMSEKLSEELLCCICRELLINATILTACGHCFCEQCIEAWLSEKKKKGQDQTCPECRAEVSTPPVPSKTLNNTVEMLAPQLLSPEDMELRKETAEKWNKTKADRAAAAAAEAAAAAAAASAAAILSRPTARRIIIEEEEEEDDDDEDDDIDDESEMNVHYTLEYARSGRSSCRGCRGTIALRELRLGKTFNTYEGYENTWWFHLACGRRHTNVYSVPFHTIYGVGNLTRNDRTMASRILS
eukprot:TRINITY_DN8988_c0_g1_i4.p1 TRINITY_DN8988_c0_g1~~TRINITY_DN8988_c0_g1_i4.p1  ORF type:complete len:584 (-),score=108.22 TRINITY_DN8988_c0_g1_i4:20-1732(-)